MSMASFQEKNPEALYLLWSDDDVNAFILEYYPGFYQAFSGLLPVIQADVFRYMVLIVFGGVYSDIDTVCLVPIQEWRLTNTTRMAIGVEVSADMVKDYKKYWPNVFQWCQWTIVSAPRVPMLVSVVYSVMAKIEGNTKVEEGNVVEVSGPSIWTEKINEYLGRERGLSLQDLLNIKKGALDLGDLLLLPMLAFSPDGGGQWMKEMGSNTAGTPGALVSHKWAGTWKSNH